MRLAAICLLLVLSSATNPGLRLVLDQGTLNQAVTLALSQLPHFLPFSAGNFQVQDKILDIDVGVAVRNLTLLQVSLNPLATGVVLSDPNVVAVNVQAGRVEVALEVELWVGFLKHWTSVVVSLEGVQVSAAVGVQVNAGNKPQIALHNLTFGLADIDFELSDKVGDRQLLQAVLALGKGFILKEAISLVVKAAESAVPSLNSLLASLPLTLDLAGLTIDLSKC